MQVKPCVAEGHNLIQLTFISNEPNVAPAKYCVLVDIISDLVQRTKAGVSIRITTLSSHYFCHVS